MYVFTRIREGPIKTGDKVGTRHSIYTVQCALRVLLVFLVASNNRLYNTHYIQSRGVYWLRGKTNTRLITVYTYIYIYNIKKTTRWRENQRSIAPSWRRIYIHIHNIIYYIPRGGGEVGKSSLGVPAAGDDYTAALDLAAGSAGRRRRRIFIKSVYTSGSLPKRGRKLSDVIKATTSIIIYI